MISLRLFASVVSRLVRFFVVWVISLRSNGGLVAAPFQNLDFEQANTNSISRDSVTQITSGPISELLPGWDVMVLTPIANGGLISTNVLSVINFNADIDGPNISVIDHSVWDSSFPMPGKYSIEIVPSGSTIVMSQHGDVPLSVTGLRLVGVISGPQDFVVSMNGITLVHVDNSAMDGGWNWDVSPFAGQNVELRIDYLSGYSVFRDDGFSFYAIPEPSSMLLGGLGLSLLVAARLGYGSHRSKFVTSSRFDEKG
jgi:hypothetical protein